MLAGNRRAPEKEGRRDVEPLRRWGRKQWCTCGCANASPDGRRRGHRRHAEQQGGKVRGHLHRAHDHIRNRGQHFLNQRDHVGNRRRRSGKRRDEARNRQCHIRDRCHRIRNPDHCACGDHRPDHCRRRRNRPDHWRRRRNGRRRRRNRIGRRPLGRRRRNRIGRRRGRIRCDLSRGGRGRIRLRHGRAGIHRGRVRPLLLAPVLAAAGLPVLAAAGCVSAGLGSVDAAAANSGAYEARSERWPAKCLAAGEQLSRPARSPLRDLSSAPQHPGSGQANRWTPNRWTRYRPMRSRPPHCR